MKILPAGWISGSRIWVKLLPVLAIAFLAAGCGDKKGAATAAEPGEGDFLVPRFDPNVVASIRIESSEKWIELARENDVWNVRDATFTVPARFPAVRELIAHLWDAKIARVISLASPDQFERFALPSPSDPTAGIRIVFRDNENNPIVDLIFGKISSLPADGQMAVPNGRYVIPAGGGQNVYLIEELFSYVLPDRKIFGLGTEEPAINL